MVKLYFYQKQLIIKLKFVSKVLYSAKSHRKKTYRLGHRNFHFQASSKRWQPSTSRVENQYGQRSADYLKNNFMPINLSFETLTQKSK